MKNVHNTVTSEDAEAPERVHTFCILQNSWICVHDLTAFYLDVYRVCNL